MFKATKFSVLLFVLASFLLAFQNCGNNAKQFSSLNEKESKSVTFDQNSSVSSGNGDVFDGKTYVYRSGEICEDGSDITGRILYQSQKFHLVRIDCLDRSPLTLFSSEVELIDESQVRFNNNVYIAEPSEPSQPEELEEPVVQPSQDIDPSATPLLPQCPLGEAIRPDTGECTEVLTVYSFYQAATQGVCGTTLPNLHRCSALSQQSKSHALACRYYGFEEHGTCLAGFNCPTDAYPNHMRTKCGDQTYSHSPVFPSKRCVSSDIADSDPSCLL